MDSLEVVNERLALYYGTELDGRARYRVVWSTTEIERRHGEFNEFYGHIFLRTSIGIQDVKKYPFDQDRWIVEKLFFIRNPEIITEKPGCYEPLYHLKDRFGGYLPLSWKAVDLAVKFAEDRPVGIQLTDKDWNAQEQTAIEEETEYFMNTLDDEGRSPLFALENTNFTNQRR
jgi:hypothetical protein